MKKTELSDQEDFSVDPTFIKTKIKEEVSLRVNKKYLDSVLIKTNLSQDEMNRIAALGID
ncbi:TPA: hypothetical protein DEG21_02950 [Patescibacteria group bacterium]|nr:hypothetical protein [Candidatus Gracilibacteria bacterium]HBY74828.1 hypothetical protein [Candidatus Gracilibacteria bacterium]